MSSIIPVLLGGLGLFRPLDATPLIGTMIGLRGLYGLAKPVDHGKMFGIPFADSKNTLFIPTTCARSVAAGITTLVLTYHTRTSTRPEREGSLLALGVLLCSWIVPGLLDCWLLYQTPKSENIRTHALNTAMLAATAVGILMKISNSA